MAEMVNFQQFRLKKLVGLGSGEKMFNFGKTNVLPRKKKLIFRGETFFSAKVHLPFFCTKLLKCNDFGHVLLKIPW